MKVKILGVSLEANLGNPQTARRFEDSVEQALLKMREAEAEPRGSDGMKMQCQAVYDAMEQIFGTEGAQVVLGKPEELDILRCMDAFDEYVNIYDKQVTPMIEKRAERYSRARLNGR